MRKVYKVIAATGGAIVLGAIGSGVWEYVFEPVLSSGTRAVLDVATLGIESYKDDLYEEVAKGLHEKASYSLLSKFNILSVLVLLLFAANTLKKIKSLDLRRDRLLSKIRSMESEDVPEEKSLSEIKQELENTKVSGLMKVSYVLIATIVLLLSAQYVTSKRDSYVNEAIAHYMQVKRIVAPYISGRELLVFDSRFSLIKSSENYRDVVGDIEKLAKKENLTPPEFDAW